MKLSSLGAAASVAFLLAGIAPLASQSTINYHLIKTVTLPQAHGSREYFDYLTVDPDARRV